MNIKTKIIQTLKSVEVPLYFMTNFDAQEDTYMVFFIERVKEFSSCDDIEEATSYEIMLHIYSKTDYDDLSSEVLTLLKQEGFKRRMETEDYDDQTNFYIKAIKLDYIHYNLV